MTKSLGVFANIVTRPCQLAPRKPVLFSGNLELPLMCFEGLLENDNEFRGTRGSVWFDHCLQP